MIRVPLKEPHPGQLRIDAEARRFNVVCCGRRWGKTQYGIYAAVRTALHRSAPGAVLWFSPTYRMLSEAWRELCRRLAPVVTEKSVQEHRLALYGGGSIECWSLDNPDAPRGRKGRRAIIDEAALVPNLKHVFEAVLRPMLMDERGDAWFLSTPRGYDDYHDLWSRGADPEFPEWASWQMPTSTNPYIHADEIEAARAGTDPVVYAAEYEAQFTSRAGLVYFQFSRHANVSEVADNGGEIRIGMDFNVDPMSAVVWVKASDEMHVIDEIELRNSGTEEMCAEIERRYPRRQVIVYPDPSGAGRRTAAPVGQTDFSILRKHRFAVHAPNMAPPVVDRVNETNALLCNAQGRRRLLINPRCRRLIACLERLSYKDNSSVIDKAGGHDHMTDALGYSVHMEWPIGQKSGQFKVLGA